VTTDRREALREAAMGAEISLRRLVADGWSALSESDAIRSAEELRAALAAADPTALDVERLTHTGVNVWGWDISRARQYAETFAAEYARLAREEEA
jgi:hypothetical protein